METGKQLFLLFSFIFLTSIILLCLFAFLENDFVLNLGILGTFSIASLLLFFLILDIVKYENLNKTESLQIIEENKDPIIEFNYNKEEWDKFAFLMYNYEVFKFRKLYFSIMLGLMIFLFLLYGDKIFFLFLFLFTVIFIPIFISKILKLKKRKNIYLNFKNPSVKITYSGILTNSEIVHYFNGIGGSFYDAEIYLFKSIECLKITSFIRSNRGGGSFKTSYVPIPANNKIDIKEKILFLKRLKKKNILY